MLDELSAVLRADLPSQDDAAKLREILYRRCYTRSILDEEAAPAGGDTDLAPALAAANQGRAVWVEGWRIEQVLGDGRITARRNGAERAFLPGEYITHRGIGTGLKEGIEISVFASPGTNEIQDSFYYAIGETVAECEPVSNLVRIYWNVRPEGAPRLMEALTREFNRFQVPFRFKCLNHAKYFPRRDAAVLYIDGRYYPIATLLVERVHGEVLPLLNAGTPLFTRRLAPGLALAEDPGESFGQHRCAILGEAMAATRTASVADRLAELSRQFENRDLSLDTPWLNAHSTAQYEYPWTAE
jgi:hypothetical protein